ncbi:hypothetical protein RND71_014305 [Anisodus tanguticus]|uniref:HTH myb-type domain-containing protein n=1 Tax=Anisodus tanguticus TaxID=243964 RepID=A0AAE1SAY8_9SOLA|nr:hypothetical protein RND71_014305 [Anisodus tanguticus]
MASSAMSILSKGKEKIDVMIINVHSLDSLSFQLLDQTVAMGIVSLFVCDEHDAFLAKKAFSNGAYLYLKKPLDEKIVKYLWQFVLREKLQREKVREELEENEDQVNADDIDNNNIVGDEEQAREKNISNTEEQGNNIHEAENDIVSNEKYKLRRKRGRKNTKEISEGDSQSSANKIVRKKVCTKWTLDLHAKFMKAVQQLGEGRCYPKDIREAMNVPDVTRMQIASHLQKCRNNNWRAPRERKSIRRRSGQGSSSGSQQRSSHRNFGVMPSLQTNDPNLQQQQHNPDQTQRGLEFSSSPNTNNIFSREEISAQQQLYHPQIQIQSHYLSIDNPLNNPFLSAQSNVGGEPQKQYGPLFGMLVSQEFQGPIIESTNYSPGLAFSGGDHHTQNDYNLDLNVAHVTTYTGSTIMSGTTNANFQQYIGEPNMPDASNIIATSHEIDNEGSDLNEREDYDVYFNFNNMDYPFQNLEPPTANLPNEHDNEFDQVYFDDQVSASI